MAGRKYSQQFRDDAVALVAAGATQVEVCRDLGVSRSALAKWVAASNAASQGLDPKTVDDSAVRELIRRNRLLEQENEVLRRAAAYLSQAHIPKN